MTDLTAGFAMKQIVSLSELLGSFGFFPLAKRNQVGIGQGSLELLGCQALVFTPGRLGPIINRVPRQNGPHEGSQCLGDIVLSWRHAEYHLESFPVAGIAAQARDQAAPDVI